MWYPLMNRKCKGAIGLILAVIIVLISFGGMTVAVAKPHSGGHASSAVDHPKWLDKLENQINYEEMMQGMEGRQDRVDKTFRMLMDNLKRKLREHAALDHSVGIYHDALAAN